MSEDFQEFADFTTEERLDDMRPGLQVFKDLAGRWLKFADENAGGKLSAESAEARRCATDLLSTIENLEKRNSTA